jgi:hypothetical protein
MTTGEKSISVHYPESLDPAVLRQLQGAIYRVLAPSALGAAVEFVPESELRFDESKITWKVDPITHQDVAVVTPQTVREYATSRGQSSHALSQMMNRLYREAENPHFKKYFLWDNPPRRSRPRVLGLRAATASELARNYGDYVGTIAGIGQRGIAAFIEFCETLTVTPTTTDDN